MNNSENKEEIVQDDQKFLDSTLKSHLADCMAYHSSMGFPSKWAEYERFAAGDQWPPSTERTKDLPRPVFNMIEYIQNHKKAAVSNENIKMVFTSEEVQDPQMSPDEVGFNEDLVMSMYGSEMFTKYSETLWENIQQDKINDEVLSSGSNCGTGLVHYYWNNGINGGIANKYVGDIEGEFIDPANCFVGNPQQNSVQRQPWIIITKREDIDIIKKMAENNNIPPHFIKLITANKDSKADLYDSAKNELSGSKKATLITEYYKKDDGLVYFKKAVNDVIVQPETCTDLELYPIAVFTWKPRKKCFYGIGDTEGLIPNQKGVNTLMGLMLMSVQSTAWPKLLVKDGALNQTITNTPGEIINDNYYGDGDGIKYMQTGQFNPIAMSLVEMFSDMTKSIAGANDAAVGEAPGADMAAQAIMLLQKSAGLPLENIKKRFYLFIEDIGRIWEKMIKVKYNTERSVKIKDKDGKEQSKPFNGSAYKDFGMSLKIDIGPASMYSEYVAQSTLDKLFDSQQIPVDLYLKYCPRSSVPFKANLLEDIKKYQMQLQQQMPMGDPNSPNPVMPQEMPVPDGVADLGINEVHEPSIENVGTNNGKM